MLPVDVMIAPATSCVSVVPFAVVDGSSGRFGPPEAIVKVSQPAYEEHSEPRKGGVTAAVKPACASELASTIDAAERSENDEEFIERTCLHPVGRARRKRSTTGDRLTSLRLGLNKNLEFLGRERGSGANSIQHPLFRR